MNHPMQSRRGFTIIEATITIVIIAMLAGVLLLAARKAISTTRIEGERRVVASMKMAVEQFKNDFGFLPPLIDDHIDNDGNPSGNVLDGNDRPDVRDDVFLSSEAPSDPSDPRYSIYSLQWFLMGALNQTDANGPLDGGAGPKFTKPQRDGTFSRKGKLHDPLYDPSRAGTRNIFGRYPATSPEEARISLTDRWGQPIRYYRWKSQFGAGGNVSQFLVPRSVGDPANNPALRDAQFAIVSLGPDQRTDTDTSTRVDRRPLPTSGNVTPAVDNTAADPSVNDNIVEVGR